MKNLGIFGSSGLAREIFDIAEEVGYDNIVFIDLEEGIEQFTKLKIVPESHINKLHDFEFVIALGEGKFRRKIYDKFPNLQYVNLIHPSVTFGKRQLKYINVTKGNIFGAGTRLTNNINIGNFNLFNLNTTVGHDCIIDNFVTISPGANISGNVYLKDCCYVGTGATILQGKSLENKLVLGEGSTVGAGAVVVKDVEANTIVKGIPAK